MTLVFMVAGEALPDPRVWWQVGGGIADRLDARLFVVGDDRHVAGIGIGRTQNRHLAIDAEHFSHFLFERRITPFQVIADLVWFDRVAVEDLADRARREVGQARMSGRHGVLAHMPRQ